jgi:hypothetical protein
VLRVLLDPRGHHGVHSKFFPTKNIASKQLISLFISTNSSPIIYDKSAININGSVNNRPLKDNQSGRNFIDQLVGVA